MKKFIQLLMVVIVLGTVTFSASAQRVRRTSPEDALRAADQNWLKVFAAKNVDRSVELCAADGSVLAPNAPIATGREGIGKLFTGFFALPGFTISWKPERVAVARSGDLGYTSGAYHLTFTGPDGRPITDDGKYVTVWKKQADGSWKVQLDIFNTDLPLSAAP